MKLEDFRQNYTKGRLLMSESPANPFLLFEHWISDAIDAKTLEPNAMVLSTCDEKGRLSSRIVLLKSFSGEGFVFFTNYHSLKGTQLVRHPEASLLFWWQETERQVEIHGNVIKINAAESDEYFNSRPLESRVGAIVSDQSAVVHGDDFMDMRFQEKMNQKGKIERPEHWGGFRVVPDQFRFWQGRPGRLHDRIRYSLESNNLWKLERLAP